MKLLRLFGLLVGLFLVAVLIHAVGWASIRITLGLLGWKYLIVIAYPIIWVLLNTAGWWYGCRPTTPIPPFRNLVEIRLAGEAFNSLLPSSYIGGEPVKIKLLSTWTSLHEATSSVLIAKAAQSIGLPFYIAMGFVLGLPLSPSASPAFQEKAWLALGLLTLAVVLFTMLLAHQSFSRIGRRLHGLTRWHWLQRQEARLVALDESLGHYYRECKGRFLASILLQSGGWLAGAVELWMIFYLMGHAMTWRQAWFMAAIAQLGAVIGLISPGGLGFYEAGHYVAAVLLGLPPELAVSASLIRRVREIFWDGVGLYFFWRSSKPPAAENV